MRYDRKASQSRRVKFLEYDPIADHVLDIVGHHGEHVSDELRAETGWRIAAKDRAFGEEGLSPFVVSSIRGKFP